MADLLIPEVLSVDALKNSLQSNNVCKENLNGLDKATLLQLYYRYIQPKPQRKYRSNRQGTGLTQVQDKMNRKRSYNAITGIGTSTGIVKTSQPVVLRSGIVRLKPPCVSGSFEKKVIKLKKDSQSDNITAKCKATENKNLLAESTTILQSNAEMKSPVTENSTSNSEVANSLKKAQKIKLVRPSLNVTSNSTTVDSKTTKSEIGDVENNCNASSSTELLIVKTEKNESLHSKPSNNIKQRQINLINRTLNSNTSHELAATALVSDQKTVSTCEQTSADISDSQKTNKASTKDKTSSVASNGKSIQKISWP